jgi:phage baseplate assembly protein W
MTTYLTRAEAVTGTNTKKVEFFSDFLDSFARTPYGNQLGRITNEQSVTQSLKNIILTNLGERLFQPFIGSNVNAFLFEPNSGQFQTLIESYIDNAIKNNEPRVNTQEISVNLVDDYSIQISIVYNLINNPIPLTFAFLLKRVR